MEIFETYKIIKILNNELIFSEDKKSLLSNTVFYGESQDKFIYNKKEYNVRNWTGKSKISLLIKNIKSIIENETKDIFNFVSISKYDNKEYKLFHYNNLYDNSNIVFLFFGNEGDERFIRFENNKKEKVIKLKNGIMFQINNTEIKDWIGFIESCNILENNYLFMFRHVNITE